MNHLMKKKIGMSHGKVKELDISNLLPEAF